MSSKDYIYCYQGSALRVAGSTAVIGERFVPDNVLVFKFDDESFDPSSYSTITGAVWTQLSNSPNVWKWDATDVKNTNWDSVFMNLFTWKPKGERGAVRIKAAGNMTIPTVLGTDSSPWPGMFRGNLALTDVCPLKFPNVINSANLFNGCKYLNLAGLYVPNTASLKSAFKAGNNQVSFSTRIGTITTSSALKDVEQMFYGWASLIEAPYFETSGVNNMTSMFKNCQSIRSIPLFDTSSCTNMSYMFSRCTSLTTVPLFNTSSCTDMGGMFDSCTSLTTVPLFDTSSCTDMGAMFYNCTALTSVPLFDTSSCTNMNNMFIWCTKVESGALALYQQASTQANVPTHSGAFKYCGSNTVTGSAELAQIPTSWGGTMA